MKLTICSTIVGLLLAGTAQAQDWSGPYIGAAIAPGIGAAYSGAVAKPFDLFGTQLSAHAGYNWTFSPVVLGLELDLTGLPLARDAHSPTLAVHWGIDFTSSFRGRIGMPIGNFMPYLTAGLAVGGINVDASVWPHQVSDVFLGYAVGGGIEAFVTKSVTVRVEAMATGLGPKTLEPDPHSFYTVGFSRLDLRLGASFHF